MYQLASTPLSVGQVLDRGFALFRESFSSVLPLMLATAVLSVVIALLDHPTDVGDPGGTMRSAALWITAWVLSAPLSIGMIAIIGAVAGGGSLAVSDALGVGVRRLIPFILASTAYVLAVGVGSLALLVPGLILSISLSMFPYAVVLDGRGPLQALRYSRSLIRGNWWRTAGILSIILVIAMVLYLLVGTIGAGGFVIFGAPNAEQLGFVGQLASSLLQALFSPLFSAFGMTIYFDLKLRREGADIEARLQAVESGRSA